MSNCPVIAFAPLVLKRDDFLVLALFENFSSYFCTGDEWVSMRHVFSVGKQQHITEGGSFAGFYVQNIDVYRIAFRDTKLPASSFDNCVSHKLSEGRKAAQDSTTALAWQTESLLTVTCCSASIKKVICHGVSAKKADATARASQNHEDVCYAAALLFAPISFEYSASYCSADAFHEKLRAIARLINLVQRRLSWNICRARLMASQKASLE